MPQVAAVKEYTLLPPFWTSIYLRLPENAGRNTTLIYRKQNNFKDDKMKNIITTSIGKRIPRKWWFAIAGGLILYVLCSLVITDTIANAKGRLAIDGLNGSSGEHLVGKNLDLDFLNHTRSNTLKREAIPLPLKPQDIKQVLDPPPGAEGPKLLFNEEGLGKFPNGESF